MLDGAMGTMIQSYELGEADYRGDRFADWASDVRGNNDLLTLTRPQVIREIHRQFLDAGADIIDCSSGQVKESHITRNIKNLTYHSL